MNTEASNNASPARRRKAGGGRAFHSRLELFVDFIRAQRQRRKTWKEIAEALGVQKDCIITLQGVHQFYRGYMKRLARPHWERAPVLILPPRGKPSPDSPRASTPSERPFRKPPLHSIQLNDPNQV